MRHLTPLTALAAVCLLLAGCSGDATQATHNAADVTFAQQMIPHHQQALTMAQVAKTRAESPEVRELAAAIEAAQAPEIAQMTGWLDAWDEDVPDAEHAGHTMGAGMMDDGAMSELMDTSGVDFDRMFLTMMIEHHEGAIESARDEQADGRYKAAITLAEAIESAQTTEIARMRSLLTQ